MYLPLLQPFMFRFKCFDRRWFSNIRAVIRSVASTLADFNFSHALCYPIILGTAGGRLASGAVVKDAFQTGLYTGFGVEPQRLYWLILHYKNKIRHFELFVDTRVSLTPSKKTQKYHVSRRWYQTLRLRRFHVVPSRRPRGSLRQVRNRIRRFRHRQGLRLRHHGRGG